MRRSQSHQSVSESPNKSSSKERKGLQLDVRQIVPPLGHPSLRPARPDLRKGDVGEGEEDVDFALVEAFDFITAEQTRTPPKGHGCSVGNVSTPNLTVENSAHATVPIQSTYAYNHLRVPIMRHLQKMRVSTTYRLGLSAFQKTQIMRLCFVDPMDPTR
jgi:hypothetical protein